MNFAQVARILAGFVAFFTLAQLPSLVLALQETAHETFVPVAGFVASMIVGAVVAGLLALAGRAAVGQIYHKEAIAVSGLAWIFASLLGAVPFLWSGLLGNPIDAVFETTSGLTTCGATMLGSGPNVAIEQVPHSLLLWRAMTQWLGGLGIVLVFVALLPAMGISGKNLLASEAVGVGSGSYQPRALEKARLIAGIYLVLTGLCIGLLVLVGDYSWFDAMCQAFAALATGGYSTRTSIADFHSLPGEIVLSVFMFLAGCSFATLATNWRPAWRALPALARTSEFRIYGFVTLAVIAALTLSLVRAGMPFSSALRQASFNGISVLTSTGFATADYQAWPSLAILVLFCSMIVGGCSGSTAGGIKQVRLLVILKLSAYTIRHFVRPKSVERIKVDNEVLPASVISSILAIVLLWCISLILCAIVATLDERLNFTAALTASASMIGSCGPSMTLVEPASAAQALLNGTTASTLAGTPNIGPMGGYGDLRNWTKILFSFEMLLGRLELLTLLALLTPSFWRH